MLDEALGPLRSGGFQEVGPANLQDVIDEPSELVDAADGEVPFEKDSIETRKTPSDESGKLGEEGRQCFHGIRLY